MKDILLIEICPKEPRADLAQDIDAESTLATDLLDCTKSGDAEPACDYVAQTYDVQFIVADPALDYARRPALDSEITETCKAIYFDSDSDFDDSDICESYLIWETAFTFVQSLESEGDS